MKITSTNFFEISHTKEAEVRDTFQRGLERDIILHFLKVEVLLTIYQIKITLKLRKYCQNGTKMVLKA